MRCAAVSLLPIIHVPPHDGGLVSFGWVVLPLSLLVRSSSSQAIRHGGSSHSLCVFEDLEIS